MEDKFCRINIDVGAKKLWIVDRTIILLGNHRMIQEDCLMNQRVNLFCQILVCKFALAIVLPIACFNFLSIKNKIYSRVTFGQHR